MAGSRSWRGRALRPTTRGAARPGRGQTRARTAGARRWLHDRGGSRAGAPGAGHVRPRVPRRQLARRRCGGGAGRRLRGTCTCGTRGRRCATCRAARRATRRGARTTRTSRARTATPACWRRCCCGRRRRAARCCGRGPGLKASCNWSFTEDDKAPAGATHSPASSWATACGAGDSPLRCRWRSTSPPRGRFEDSLLKLARARWRSRGCACGRARACTHAQATDRAARRARARISISQSDARG